VPPPDPSSWPYLAASTVAHVVYVMLLIRAYRVAHFSQVYPISRGLSPVLVTAAMLILFGETLTPTQVGSIALIVTGLPPSRWPGSVASRSSAGQPSSPPASAS
jgi:uncharacterized membrane protein